MKKNRILVSVITNAYNQEKYIRDTLDGFLMQKTDFGFECLVHDDASTDSTADIIREYENRYPDIIRPTYEIENQYSQHVFLEQAFHYPKAFGEYIAECEGDDYWTDPYKLQKQVEALETHPDVDICAHAAMVEENGKITGEYQPNHKAGILPVEDVILGGGGFVATASLMYRKSVVENIPKFHQIDMVDYGMQILGSLRGGMLFLEDNMAVYRYMAEGSWTEAMRKSREKKKANCDLMIRMLEQLDIDTKKRFHDSVTEARQRLEFERLGVEGNLKAMKLPPYDRFYRKLSSAEKRRLWENTNIPEIVKLKQTILSWINRK